MSLAAPAPDSNQVRVRLDLSAPSRRGELSFAVNGGEPVVALPLQRRALVYIPRGRRTDIRSARFPLPICSAR